MTENVVLIFIDDFADDPTKDASDHSGLHECARNGYGGTLVINQQDWKAELQYNELVLLMDLTTPRTSVIHRSVFTSSRLASDEIQNAGLPEHQVFLVEYPPTGSSIEQYDTLLESIEHQLEQHDLVVIHLPSSRSTAASVLTRHFMTFSKKFVAILSPTKSSETPKPGLGFPKPIQSYQVSCDREPVREIAPKMLVYVAHQRGKTRRDSVQSFQSHEIVQHGAYGAMLIQAFVKELAFRLAKAPKYGA